MNDATPLMPNYDFVTKPLLGKEKQKRHFFKDIHGIIDKFVVRYNIASLKESERQAIDEG